MEHCHTGSRRDLGNTHEPHTSCFQPYQNDDDTSTDLQQYVDAQIGSRESESRRSASERLPPGQQWAEEQGWPLAGEPQGGEAVYNLPTRGAPRWGD